MDSGVLTRIVRRVGRGAMAETFVLTCVMMLPATGVCGATIASGRRLYGERCAMCHGVDARGTGPLAHKSNPPTPDLTTAAFRGRLAAHPGIIVSSIILQPNGNLIPKTLRANGYHVPPHAWTITEFRDLDAYVRRMLSAGQARPKSRGG